MTFASTCENLILHLKVQYYNCEEVVSALCSAMTTQGLAAPRGSAPLYLCQD